MTATVRRGAGMFKSKRQSAVIREDACGVGKCDFCAKRRSIVARRGIQACTVCHARRRVVDGRFVFTETA